MDDERIRVRTPLTGWPGLSLVGFLLLTSIGVGRIVLTYPFFNQTLDEPVHLACGMRLLDHRPYCDPAHPPLARLAIALGPYLDGLHSTGQDPWAEGNAILYSRGSYMRNLTLARVGILPFFVLACALVWGWTKTLFGEPAAFFATLLFTTLPPVLAHAGLATTDMAVTAFFLCTLYTLAKWLPEPNLTRSILFGLSLGLGVVTKFSVLVFLPPCILTLIGAWWLRQRPDLKTIERTIRRRIKPLVIVLTLASLVAWACYGFSATRLTGPEHRPHRILRLL